MLVLGLVLGLGLGLGASTWFGPWSIVSGGALNYSLTYLLVLGVINGKAKMTKCTVNC